MEFDQFALVRLVRPSGYVETGEDAERIQDAHLAFLRGLWDAGHLLAAGPSAGAGQDERVRGFGIVRADVETAARLWRDDPGVRAGWFEAEIAPWLVPAGMIVAGPTAPPASAAEARG